MLSFSEKIYSIDYSISNIHPYSNSCMHIQIFLITVDTCQWGLALATYIWLVTIS